MKKDKVIFLEHIIKAIEEIQNFSKSLSKNEFMKDSLRQSAIIRQIEIIGEAVKNLPIDFINKYPLISWGDIAGMRDKLMHHYFGVNLETIWITLEEDIPTLKKQIKDILEKEKTAKGS